MFNWNNLKYLLAVARHGSTIAAARALEVNQATVQRRLLEPETRLGLRLFVRLPSGYRLTPVGAALLSAPEAVVTVSALRDGHAASHRSASPPIGQCLCPLGSVNHAGTCLPEDPHVLLCLGSLPAIY
jgi:DNA-binding transcriptional LysR family regulator